MAGEGTRPRTGRAQQPDPAVETLGSRRREAARICAWCGGPIAMRGHGPIPKWCSATCRKRAWEQTRAAASGRSAIQIVERIVQAPAQPAPGPKTPRRGEWVPLLHELARQLDTGRLYDRNLDGVAEAVDEVVMAVERRVRFRGR